MRNADRDITVFNYYLDPDTGYDICKRTNIHGVSVFAQTQVNVGTEGFVSADVYTIRIPQGSVNENYYRPVNFASLSDKSGAFTLAKGDIIVLGYANDNNPKRADLEEKYGNEYVITIVGVTDNRQKMEPHWKVIGQ